MLSVSQGVSSSYSCPGSSCPPQYSWAELSPSNIYLSPGDTAVVRVLEVDCDEFFNCIGPFYALVTGWEVTDPYAAVSYYDNGDSLDLVGYNGGTAYIRANIGYEQYYWDEFTESCTDEGWDDSGSVNGQAHAMKVTDILPRRALVGTSPRITISGRGFGNSASVEGDSGLTVDNDNNFSVNDTQISADMTIAANATPGQHTLTVHVGDVDDTVHFSCRYRRLLYARRSRLNIRQMFLSRVRALVY